ncbi:MAG TPA: hypothetical protein VMS11_11935 [Solirubrobacterales bacterium]|nr:hypothetical protein [Solirubrobacterales bacterium]
MVGRVGRQAGEIAFDRLRSAFDRPFGPDSGVGEVFLGRVFEAVAGR